MKRYYDPSRLNLGAIVIIVLVVASLVADRLILHPFLEGRGLSTNGLMIEKSATKHGGSCNWVNCKVQKN
jgi:fido (protein-threonine AMPylation protein)